MSSSDDLQRAAETARTEAAKRAQDIANAGLAMLDAFEPIRETYRGLVAAFVSDGFTEEQAFLMVVTVVTGWRWNNEPTE